jgi:hypothetical protein
MTDILLEPPRIGATADDEEGHYTCTTPDGELKKHKRASDYTGLLDENWSLRRHEDRELARGVALADDLIALARAHQHDGDKEDKDTFNDDIIPKARMLAGAGSKANIGKALHRATQDIDRGGALAAVDPTWRTHLKAYRDTMARLPFEADRRHIEQTVILDGYRIAGTIDRILVATRDISVTFPNGRKVHVEAFDRIVGDIKTGKWFTPLKWMVQLGIYSQHTATWTKQADHPHGGVRGPAIGVRQDIALVVHLQAGDPTAPCDLHWLDLEAGYDGFLTAYEIAGHRAAAKKAHCQYTDHLPTVIQTQMEAWCRARLAVVKTNPAATACLTRMWPLRDTDGQPIRYGDQPTPEQTTTLLNLLDRIEGEYSLPFTPQPGTNGRATQPTPTETQGETQ